MDLLNQKVKHKILGDGTIVGQNDNRISVEFATRTSNFLYPSQDTFIKFLQAESGDIQAAMLREIADTKAAQEEAKRVAKEEKCRAEEAQALAEASARKSARTTASKKKTAVRLERTPGQLMTFYVFHGSAYEHESRGGYIWAPMCGKNGQKIHHWDRLLDVRAGDIILHGYAGNIQAVGTAKGECYPCEQPAELLSDGLAAQEGRRIDCDYNEIELPLKTSAFSDDIIRLCNVKYSPFDRDGNGNRGYMFEINTELARIFLRGSAEHNSKLNDIDYVRDLLSEA